MWLGDVAVGSQLRLPIWLPPVTPRTRRNAAAWRRLCASQRPVLTGRRLGIGVVEETLAEVAGLLGYEPAGGTELSTGLAGVILL